jgi:hypothetical protein
MYMARLTFNAMLMGVALSFGLAWAQSEPTIAEIYTAARGRTLEHAQVMVQQVLSFGVNDASSWGYAGSFCDCGASGDWRN